MLKEGGMRLLTSNEIELAKTVFGDRVSYNKIWIHHDSFLPFGLQHERVAMTPLGEIYYKTALYREDYAKEVLSHQHTFIHELSHVWQRERGMCVNCRGILSGLVSYSYSLDGRLLSEYSMEQQSQIIADSFILHNYGYHHYVYGQEDLYITLVDEFTEPVLFERYRDVLRGFPW